MKLFIDSSFFIALAKFEDNNHLKAKVIFQDLKDTHVEFYTSYPVIDETLTVISMKISKNAANLFLKTLDDKDFPFILDVDSSSRKKSYLLFKKLRSKNISIIDCQSVILIEENKIEKYLTFDQHFKKLGVDVYKTS